MNSMQPDGSLKLPTEKMRALGYRVIDIIIEHLESLSSKPVSSRFDPARLRADLLDPLPEDPTPLEHVLEEVQQNILSSIMHLDHPRFFAFIPGPSNFVSVMADALAAGFNVFSGTWLEAPGPTEVELAMVRWLRQLCGLPDTAGGLFVSGGSVANLTALAVARHVKLRDHIEGAVVYGSDQVHSSIERGLRLLGFSQTQFRKLRSDDGFRLVPSDLQREVAVDRAAGMTPFCVIANAGTTNTGSVDPLSDLSRFCNEEGLWLHADGAYGASSMLCEEGRTLLKGLENVDSLSLDPHKWLFQPYEIGCVLIRDRRQLRETFQASPEYLKDVESSEEINLCDYGIQLTRSFRALKLWMSMRIFGLRAFREAVSRGMALAKLAEDMLRRLPNWEIVTPAQLGIVTFRY
ncbi:aminotransferase class V-fold PLP-dependent enzyme, partial [Candidatus Bathyarchaeota archaeon]|nr:aminotransferase class V-fold PLP-dependent enzyme [Candidatus Bathyarchaeota archaeon]